MRKTGLRQLVGCWKIMEMRLPRISSISGSESAARSLPSKKTAPSTIFPEAGSRRMMESEVTLLPLPDSPTSPMIWPGSMAKSTPLMACTTPSSVKK